MHGQVVKYFHNKVEWFGSHLNGNVRAVNIRQRFRSRIMDFYARMGHVPSVL